MTLVHAHTSDATRAIHDAYSRTGAAWAAGPGPAYERLAEAAIAAGLDQIRGTRVLDLGAGTGAASRCIARAGGVPVALDPAMGMLVQAAGNHPVSETHRAVWRSGLPVQGVGTFETAFLGGAGGPRRLAAVAGTAEALPFRDGCFHAVVAAFSLSHLPQPAAGLREARRVVRPGGAVLSTTFGREPPHPAKAAVNAVAQRFGHEPPVWYLQAKKWDAVTSDPARLAAAAKSAGLVDVAVRTVRVDTGLRTAEQLARWRLGKAELAPFVASLAPVQRAALFAAACEALGGTPQPWRPAILILSSRAPA